MSAVRHQHHIEQFATDRIVSREIWIVEYAVQLTRLFEFVGDNATNEVWAGAVQIFHQLVQ